MNVQITTESAPPLYSGHAFPVDKLSPAKFEEFVFSCLLNVSELLDLQLTGMPSGSRDGGFDVAGQNIQTKRIVCIQCKRQQKPLGSGLLAEELVKVAATSALEGSDVGEHRFICTGGVTKKLVSQLRETTRSALIDEAINCITTARDDEISTLRGQLENQDFNVEDVVRSYISKLDLLVAWSFQEFDVALSRKWQDILKIAERFFSIATVVREFPRAIFDRPAYVTEHQSFQTAIEPRLAPTNLPIGITAASSVNPGNLEKNETREAVSFDQICDLEAGALVVLTGDGGAGKSDTLRLIRARMLRSYPDSKLPVFIRLARYVSGALEREIRQELGISFGHWHSLPDHVFLLCDGLNECPGEHIDNFLSELEPLLKRKRITCLISTRESTARQKIILPQIPDFCLRLDEITPAGIRRIANHELSTEQAEKFVSQYRHFSDSSYSKLLWTPFAIMVGIRLWRLHSTLPPTLREMLSTLLRLRCERNIELSRHQLAPEVILLLAESLAFQCLLIDKRLECPAIEAGKLIRSAKALCEDGLGVSDLSETMAVDLLVSHNLIHRSSNGSLSFDHQLVAGALAAPLLARGWRSHVDSLGESISDDAWVFAASMVIPEERRDYVTVIIDQDLMLGARASRELPIPFRDYTKALLDLCIDPKSPEHVQINAAYALALLETESALSKLKELAKNKNHPIRRAIQRALSSTGNVDYLSKILVDVDRMKSGPFIVSGGNIDIWDYAPVPVRLDLARQRLLSCNPGDPVAESLQLVAFETDTNDLDLVEKHLNAATDYRAWCNALNALQIISPSRAQLIFERSLSSTQTIIAKASLIQGASRLGIPFNQDEAFELAVAELPSSEDSDDAHYTLYSLISKVVEKNRLSEQQICFIERELPLSTGERRSRLWQLAFKCASTTIADYAVTCVSVRGRDEGNACQYFISQPNMASEHRVQLVSLCENFIKDTKNRYTWPIQRAFSLLSSLGEISVAVALILSTIIESAVRIVNATHAKDYAGLSAEDKELLQHLPSENTDIHLEFEMANMLPAIADFRTALPVNVLASLLHMNFATSRSKWPDLLTALSDISDEVIDTELLKLTDPWATLSGLAIISERGPTPVRLFLLEKMLADYYRHPAAMNHIEAATRAFWSKEVLEMILRFVSKVEVWSEYDSQFFWDFFRLVANKIDHTDHTAIEKSLATAKTEFAKRILQLWRGKTLGPRVGLASRPL